MKSTTQIETVEGKRIAKRLLNHWKHKFEGKRALNPIAIF